ncbi:MAG: gspJ1, partial [Nitrospirae bacterium]|nr:gspJ1 [Nitrospirota bacterium]
ASASRGGGSAGFAGGGGDVSPSDGHNTQSGFTLLELLVSIVLIGLIVAIVGTAMRLGYRSLDKGEKKAEMLERFRVSLNLMDSQMQSGIPLRTTGEGEEGAVESINQYLFEGKKDSIRFASNYSLTGGQKGYVIVAYRVETGTNEKRTLFAQENTIGMENQKEVKLLEGFDDIHFEYFFKEATEEQGQWIEEWTDTATIPGKIRIHLAWGNQQISLVVPMRALSLTAQSGSIFFSMNHRGGILS